MDDGLTTTMAMMGYRVVDRIGSFVDGSMAVRASRRDACDVCVRNICIYIYVRAHRGACVACVRA